METNKDRISEMIEQTDNDFKEHLHFKISELNTKDIYMNQLRQDLNNAEV